MSALQENYQLVLEAYPEIAKKIKIFWGNQEFTDLIDELLTNTRGHQREGFPPQGGRFLPHAATASRPGLPGLLRDILPTQSLKPPALCLCGSLNYFRRENAAKCITSAACKWGDS